MNRKTFLATLGAIIATPFIGKPKESSSNEARKDFYKSMVVRGSDIANVINRNNANK